MYYLLWTITWSFGANYSMGVYLTNYAMLITVISMNKWYIDLTNKLTFKIKVLLEVKQ